MNFANGLLNLTNWLGNVIMPTVAGLFAAAAIYRFSKAQPYSHFGYAAQRKRFLRSSREDRS